MISLFLPVVITLIPFILILLVIYLGLGKKTAERSMVVFAIIFLVLVAFILFFNPPSSKKNAATTMGEKIAVQVIKQDYPGIKYSVTGRVAALGDETFNEYRIQLATDFNETAYQKLNKDICERLGDKTAHLITNSTTSDLNPLRGATTTCGQIR
jgi:hypothetical protein